MKRLLLITSTLLLSACSNQYRFQSNLDSAAINRYFKASDVTLYEQNELLATQYTLVGLVDGIDCQAALNAAPASMAAARTQMRHNAANQGANGVIIKQCIMIKDDSVSTCTTQALCTGQAIKIPE